MKGNTMSWDDIFRLINAALAAVALGWLSWDIYTRKYDLSRRSLYLSLALGGLLVAVIEGSLEVVFFGPEPGPRIAVISAACIWAIIGVWIGLRDDKKASRD